MKSTIRRIIAVIAMITGLAALTEAAKIVQPTTVTQIGGGTVLGGTVGAGGAITNLINNSGLSFNLNQGDAVPATLPTAAGTYVNGVRWYTSALPTTAELVFDLGGAQSYPITSVILYNYYEGSATYNRGLKYADVYASTNGTDYTLVQAGLTFAQETIVGGAGVGQTVTLSTNVPAGATHLKLKNMTNAGDSIIGFFEIRFVSSAPAVVKTQTGQNEVFAVSNNDLLQTSVSSVSNNLTLNVGENFGAGGNTYVILTDGAFGDTDQDPSLCIMSNTITYNLNTNVNTLGYNISAIKTYSGWGNTGRDSQAYTVSLSVVGDANFTDLATVAMNGLAFSQERWAITESAGGILVSNVDAIKFTFPLQENGGTGYKELDVIGAAVPTPEAPALPIFVGNTTFPNQNVIVSQLDNTHAASFQYTSASGGANAGLGQSFSFTNAQTLRAITLQKSGDVTFDSGIHKVSLWIGEYDSMTDPTNHTVGATLYTSTIDVSGTTFAGESFYTINLASNINLSAGVEYAFELVFDTLNASHVFNVNRYYESPTGSGADTYTDGTIVYQQNVSGVVPFQSLINEPDNEMVFALHSAAVSSVLIMPDTIAMDLIQPAILVTGSVDFVYSSMTNVSLSVAISEQSHPNSLRVLSATPQTLDPSAGASVTLEFEFDNDVAALEYGSATGLVTVVWTEVGSGVTNNRAIPISASIILQADVVNAWTAGGNGVSWGDAANWDLGRIPGVYAADQGIIQGNATVAVTTNYTGAFPYSVTVRGNSTAPTLNISANLQGMAYMWLGRDSGYWGFVNQTAGAVTSGDLKVGDAAGTATTDSVYTLSGGSHTVGTNVTVYSKGELDVNGGSLAMNGALNVNAGGIVKLTSGTLTVDANANAGSTGVINIPATGLLEISGGTFAQRGGMVNIDGTLRIIGDAASISVNIFWADCTGVTEFILDATGVSTLSNAAWGHLNTSTFRIDGANYIGPTNSILLYTGFANAGPLGTRYAVTNLGVEGVDWTLTEVNGSVAFNGSARQTVTLNILTSHEPIGYAPWAAGYGLSEVPSTVDVDSDGLINLMEYALGGNPTVDDAAAVSPVSFTAADSGTNWFYYVHNQRTDDPALIYTLGTETDLVNAPAWNTNDTVVVGESATVSHYKSVTNRTATIDSAKFIQLTVEQQ